MRCIVRVSSWKAKSSLGMGRIRTGGWRWRGRWILGIGDSERLKRWAASGLAQVEVYCIGGGGEKVSCHGYTSWTQSPSLFGPLISGRSLLGPLNTFWKPDRGALCLQVSKESCDCRMWDVGGGRDRRMPPSSVTLGLTLDSGVTGVPAWTAAVGLLVLAPWIVTWLWSRIHWTLFLFLIW